VLFEDFTEDESADARSKLLAALGLAQRRGLSREEIEAALLRFGGEIVKNSLSLDPLEFRLVCIPYDLYGRLGRERGFGKWPHWTHFDGYQVMGGNRLRALAGGDGLADLRFGEYQPQRRPRGRLCALCGRAARAPDLALALIGGGAATDEASTFDRQKQPL
jgi:hypothetical protein